MKKNDFDLTIPNRESPVAIFFILFKTIYNIVTRIWPALLVIFFRDNKESEKSEMLLWAIIVVGVIAMIFSFINYFKTYYFIQDNELYLHKGVLQKTRINIPFERIQTIQIEQSIFQVLFNVVKISMDTAGSDKKEIDFSAIDKDKAEYLRSVILQFKENKNSMEETESTNIPEKSEKFVLQLGVGDLLKVGVTRNHLKSGGVILLFLFWVYENVKDLGVDADEYYEEVFADNTGLSFYLILGILFLLISFFISLFTTVFNYFNLSLVRVSSGFKMTAGLFNKKETSSLDHKIQMISWSDNRLKRSLGFFDMYLHQAASHVMEKKQKMFVPGMTKEKIEDVVKSIFLVDIPDKKEGKAISKYYFLRPAIIITMLFVPVFITTIWYEIWNFTLFCSFLYVLFLTFRFLQYKKKYFCLTENYITIWGGAFGVKNFIFPQYKIQGVTIHQSPYQRKKGLSTIEFYLASGSVEIPYIPVDVANEIVDICLYKVETSSVKWM